MSFKQKSALAPPAPRTAAPPKPGAQVVLFNARERTHVDDARGNGFWRGCLVSSVCWIVAWFALAEMRNEEVAKVLERGAIMARAMERADAMSITDASQDALKKEGK
jgi:hypothetical protein